MTIYTPKVPEKKENVDVYYPEVVTEALVVPEKDNQQNEALSLPPTLITVTATRRRSQFYNVFVLLIAMFLLITGVFGSIYLYKHLAHRKFRGWCTVRYYEYQEEVYEPEALVHHGRNRGHHGHRGRSKHVGHFEEQVEFDRDDWKYEKIEVPDVEDTKRAIVLHDFEKNITAIVDKDFHRCFILPLNRSNTIPPQDFWDLINKIGTGYYLPDVEVIREEYTVVHPPIQDLSSLGLYVWYECSRFDTYKLLKHNPGDPIAMVKRSIDGTRAKYFLPGSQKADIISII